MATTLVLVGVVLAAVLFAYWQFPDVTRQWFRRLQQARQVVFGLFAIIVAVVLLGSGYWPLMLLGALSLGYGVLWLLYEEPHETVIKVVS